MSARANAAYRESERPASVTDENFLRKVAEILERLRTESQQRGHSLLASMLDVAKAEAQDGLRTQASVLRLSGRRKPDHALDDDDGVVRMAEKLAWRAQETVEAQ